ncbi:MAG: hypothetical protein IIX84_07795 [Oscillospiraceae bacterium]|nr:hypothetical protein [Oscillospiraceae bacterium]
MKKRVFCAVSLFLSLFLTLGFGGGIADASALDGGNSGECRFEPAKRDVRRLMLGKYYISSEEDMEQELLWDFENRLYTLCYSLGYEPSAEEIEAKNEEFFAECCFEAESLGITPEENARQKYLVTAVTECLSIDKKLAPEYFTLRSTAELRIEWAVSLLAELWELAPEQSLVDALVLAGVTEEEAEKEALKTAVMDYSVDNSRIVRRQKNVNFFFKKLNVVFFMFTNDQPLIPAYLPDADGYAALYNKEYGLNPKWLEPFLGELIVGTASCDAIYRFRGMDDWDWIIVRRNGEYGLYHFVEWIEDGSSEYNEFTVVYGFEPMVRK